MVAKTFQAFLRWTIYAILFRLFYGEGFSFVYYMPLVLLPVFLETLHYSIDNRWRKV